MRTIVLLSGGQDSTTCLYYAKHMAYTDIHAISFDYGQKHRDELHLASINAMKVGATHKIFKLDGLLEGSSLVDHSADHNTSHSQDPKLPASFTAGRNALFLTLAASYAYNHGITDIITGVCQTDYSGYPDCREVFIKQMQAALTLALDKPIVILTPLMHLTKAETWKMAKEIGCIDSIINLTMTDYNGDRTMNEWGFGKLDNPASQLRAKGYFEAKEKGWI